MSIIVNGLFLVKLNHNHNHQVETKTAFFLFLSSCLCLFRKSSRSFSVDWFSLYVLAHGAGYFIGSDSSRSHLSKGALFSFFQTFHLVKRKVLKRCIKPNLAKCSVVEAYTDLVFMPYYIRVDCEMSIRIEEHEIRIYTWFDSAFLMLKSTQVGRTRR